MHLNIPSMMGNQEKKYLWKNTLGSQKGLSFLKFKEKSTFLKKDLIQKPERNGKLKTNLPSQYDPRKQKSTMKEAVMIR